MLAFIRKWLTSWPVLALLGLVLVAFVVTGVSDPFGSKAAGGAIAKVGDAEIGEQALLSQFDRVIRRARETNPLLTAQQAAREGAVGQVLDQLIGTTALEQFGKRAGVAISERAVDGEIASVEAFRVGGKFDQATFRRILSQQRLSERELREGLHGDLVRKQLLAPVGAGLQTQPRAMVEPYAALLLEQRQGQVGLIPASAAPAPPPPSDAQLQAYFAANKARYTLPERRAFRYALIDAEAIAAGVAITDADIQSYFDRNKAQFGGIETRTLAQVVVPDEAAAKALAAAVRGGKPFADAASAAGFAPADTALGTLAEGKFAADTNAAVAAAAFALPRPGVTDPVKSAFGWHVVAVEKIQPAKVKQFADARGEIVAALRRSKADQAVADTVARIEDALSGGQSFADVARANKLAVVTVPPLTSDGRMLTPSGFTLPPVAVPLLPKVFDADPADGATVQEIGKGQFALLEVGAVTPPTPPPFEQLRPQLAAAYAAQAQMTGARAIADAVIADLGRGVPLAQALSSRKLPPPQPINGRRIDALQNPKLPPSVQAFLSLPKGGIKLLPAGAAGGYFVVQVDSLTPGDPAALPQLVDAMGQQFAQIAPDELAGAFAQAVERETGVKRNAAALNAANRRIIGEGDAAAAQ